MKFIEFKKLIDQKAMENTDASEISSKMENLELILDIVKKINKTLVLEDVLDLVLKHALKLSKTERGFIVLMNKNKELEFNLGLDNQGNELPSTMFNISKSVVEDVYRNGQSIFKESALSDRGADTSKSIVELELQTILCSPLIAGGKKIGVVYVDSKKLQRIKIQQITDTFEILAGQAAIAINNAQLFHEHSLAYKELKRKSTELKEAKEKAEISDKLKSEFLAQISHEIRTPLNTILSYTSLLKSELADSLPDNLNGMFVDIDKGGRRLMRTVDSILNMAMLQKGTFDIKFSKIDIDSDVLSKIILETKATAENKGLDLRYKIDCKDKMFSGDYYTVVQIFSHLIDNAIKFTEKGKVEVTVTGDDSIITVNVNDTGIGISENYIQDIFNPFSQETTGYSRSYDGNGLGLSLVKEYIRLNKAKIRLDSKKGQGTNITVKFIR